MNTPGRHTDFEFVAEAQFLPPHLKGAAVAIGNFDGVHLGHRSVLDKALEVAQRLEIPSLVLTFEPHPRTFFRPENPVFRLTPAPMKVDLLRQLGFDGVVQQQFDLAFSRLAAGDFVAGLLAGNLAAAHVVAGQDFHFGHKREGTPDFLLDRAAESGISVDLVDPRLSENGEVISSTRIRAALGNGEIVEANSLLGREWSVRGEVIRGKQLGRQLGFPTANLALPPETELKHGIYAVRVNLPDGAAAGGVASFGRRPTFDNGAVLLETFIFDYAGDLYGKTIEVAFADFLREEAKFDGAEALVEQMTIDAAGARKALARSGD